MFVVIESLKPWPKTNSSKETPPLLFPFQHLSVQLSFEMYILFERWATTQNPHFCPDRCPVSIIFHLPKAYYQPGNKSWSAHNKPQKLLVILKPS